MHHMLLVYGYLAWVVFMATAIANGIFRVRILETSLSEPVAHVVSTAILCVLLFIEIDFFLGIAGDSSDGWLLALGAMWLLLTVAFEFGFGHYVAGQSWPALLENYNLKRGRIWPAVLAVVFFTPILIG